MTLRGGPHDGATLGWRPGKGVIVPDRTEEAFDQAAQMITFTAYIGTAIYERRAPGTSVLDYRP